MKKMIAICFMFGVVFLTGCGTKDGASPKSTTELFFKGLQESKWEQVQQWVENPNDLPKESSEELNLFQLSGKTVQYEMLEEISKGDTECVYNVKVVNGDSRIIEEAIFVELTQFLVENPKVTEQQIKEKQKELTQNQFNEKKIPYTAQEVKVKYKKVEEVWKITFDSNLKKGVFGQK